MEHINQFEDRELFEHYIDQTFRHEFTITYNPKFIYDIDYADSMTDFVIKDIVSLGKRVSTDKRSGVSNKFYFNYVVERHENGWPHIHGTLFTLDRIKPQTLANWEASFGRKYGRTAVWATGLQDKIHKNDHFEGTWQNYLHKEGVVKMYEYSPFTENRARDNNLFNFLVV